MGGTVNGTNIGGDYQSMLNTQMSAQKEAEKYQLMSTLLSMRHQTISSMIQNCK